VSSGIAFVFMLALMLGASGVLAWSRGDKKRSAQSAQRFFDRQMDALGTRSTADTMEARVARAHQRRAQRQALEANDRSAPRVSFGRVRAEIENLMRRADVRNPRSALTVFAAIAGVAALVSATRVGAMMAPAAVALCTLCFYVMLVWRAQKRNQRIVRQLPPFLDSIVRLVSVGHSVPAALQAASTSAEAPLRDCLAQVIPRLATGTDIDQALASVARVYRVQEFDLIGAVLRISIKFGGRSDVMLERMAAFMRDLEQADRELVALSTETRLSSWVLGVLPIVLGAGVIVMNPGYFDSMWNDPLGKKLVFSAFGLQILGAYLLYRLARIKQ
jgi:tight adherence protein B